jgi:hypothetical protein
MMNKTRKVAALALACAALGGCAIISTEDGQRVVTEASELIVREVSLFARILTESDEVMTTESNNPLRLDP